MAVIRMSLDDSHFSSANPKEKNDLPSSPVMPNKEKIFVPRVLSGSLKMQKKRFSKKIIFLAVGIIMLVLIGMVGKNLIAKISPTSGGVSTFIPVLKPKLSKDTENKTNVLLVGIDTRETGTVELSTDTIILASYDENTNRLAMLSFPRDLAVSYPGRTDLVRINSIYAIGENKKKGTGLEKLKEVVEGISGKTIQYYAMVDLKGFMDSIDVVGGIDIYLENDISGLYPTEGFLYERVSFKRGWNHMNGKSALQYSRMRKGVIPAGESSDFARAKRQQKVIQAVIDKVSKTETLLDAKKVFELASVTTKNLKISKVTLEDMQAGVSLLKDKGKPTSYSYVLDLYAGGDLGKLVSVISTNPYLVGPVSGAGKWSSIQNFVKLYYTEPVIAAMTKKIVIYTDGSAETNQPAQDFKKKFYFGNIEVTSKNAPGINSKGGVYATGGSTYTETAKFLAAQLGLQFKEEMPEEIKNIDSKEYSIVAVY